VPGQRGELVVGPGRSEAGMLRLAGAGRVGVRRAAVGRGRELPADLAARDRLLGDHRLLAPIEQAWEQTARARPTDQPDGRFRAAHRCQAAHRLGLPDPGAGGVGLAAPAPVLPARVARAVPDESTVPKLVRRLGPEIIAELTRVVVGKAQRETRFRARVVRIDAAVIRPTSATRPTRGWPGRGRGRWPRGPQAGQSAARADSARDRPCSGGSAG
jgi:hypothetical protein